MQPLLLHAVTVFMGFFAIMNPVANTPVFLALTADDPDSVRRAVARQALIYAFVIIVVFATTGRLIFDVFGISLYAFQITGGLLVLLLGYQMLQGRQSSVHHTSRTEGPTNYDGEMSKAVTPLAMPLLAGPGTIVAAINFTSKGGFGELLVTLSTYTSLCIITYFSFVYGERMVKYLGRNGIAVVVRLMGLILAVIGTQMFVDGVQDAVKSFHPHAG